MHMGRRTEVSNMYKKIVQFVDKDHFGDKIVIFQGKDNYFIIMCDRGETAYFFLDNALQYLYPVNSYIRNIGYQYKFEESNDTIEIDFKIDLVKYGHMQCPEYLKKLIVHKSVR